MKQLGLLFASILIVNANASAFAQNFQGRVIKQNARLARPSEQDIDASDVLTSGVSASAQQPLSKGITDDGFVLNANQYKEAVTALDGWNPYSGIAQTARRAQSILSGQTSQASAPVAVDYDAVERAYAASVPRIAPRLVASHANGTPSVVAATAFSQAALQNGMNPYTGAVNQNASAHVDVDNCACDMMIPSSHCVTSRMQGFGVNVNPGSAVPPTVHMPGRPTMPVVSPSAVSRASGMGLRAR